MGVSKDGIVRRGFDVAPLDRFPATKRRWLWGVFGAFVLALGFALSWLGDEVEVPSERGGAAPPAGRAEDLPPPAVLPPPQGLGLAEPTSTSVPPREPPGPDVRGVAAASETSSSPSDAQRVSPHPMTPSRLQMQAERELMEQAKSAAQSGDGAQLDSILDEYDSRPPSGHFADWYEGYRLIAQCLRSPGTNATSQGAHFIENHPGSTLRRSVRKYCEVAR